MEGRRHISMDVQGLSSLALSAGVRTQNALRTETQRLSSGLRINTAADDPSGLAIAESLASKVAGLDQGVHEVQNANNALTVAEGAMSSISSILQRMRALVVQARNDLASNADRADIQAELDQLRLEIDKIAQNTSFNGRNLLDGSASSAITQPEQVIIETNDGLTGGGLLIDQSFDPSTPTPANNAPQLTQLLTVSSYDPITDTLQITATIESTDPGSFGPAQIGSQTIANGTNYPQFSVPPTVGTPAFTQVDQFGNPVLSFNISNLSPGDVGKTSVLITIPAEMKAAGGALQVNSGDAEGSVVSVDIPALSSVNLGVNQVVIGDDLQNQGAEYRIDYAIGKLGGARAVVGAQIVALQETANAGNVASVNTQASESAIRDLNIGAEVTAHTRDAIINQFQMRLVADTERLAQNFASLVSASIVR
jgi:flagellin